MTLDQNALCPGGTGKKIRFCGCRDIVPDLDKVSRAIEGEQRAAALQQLDRLLASHSDRLCLMALKARIHIEQSDVENLASITERMLALAPDNPIALAQQAFVDTARGDLASAVEHSQRSADHCDGQISGVHYMTMHLLAQMLLRAGLVMSGRRHAYLLGRIDPKGANELLDMVLQLNQSLELPMLFKRDYELVRPPEEASWRAEFDAAASLVGSARWLAAAEKLEAVAEQGACDSLLLRNIATLRSWLGDLSASAAAWRAYAAADDTPLDEAVEAEARAQLIDEIDSDDVVRELTVSYPVDDIERLMEHLISHGHVTSLPVNLADLAEEDQPPPKGVFHLLDRAMPSTGVDLNLQDVPNILGELYLFGKQTDREARLEFVATEHGDYPAKKEALEKMLGEWAGAAESEETTAELPAGDALRQWRWHLPQDTPEQRRRELTDEQHRRMVFETWPDTPHAALDGKRPCDVAADPAYRVRLLGAILALEANEPPSPAEVDYNKLRQQLGLPTRDEVDPATLDLVKLSPVDLSRLPAAKLDDDQLANAFQRTIAFGARQARRALALEVVARPQLADKVPMSAAYRVLASSAREFDEATEYVRKGKEATRAEGGSLAPWLLSELPMCLKRGDVAQFQQIVQELKTRHANEPGVMESLYHMLVNLGLITPEGTPAHQVPSEQPGVAAADETAGQPGKLWVPGSEPATTGEQKEKPSLWVPGSD